MDIGRTITFVFDDEEWLKKVLIGGCLMLLPIVGQLMAMGYGLEIARRVVKGHPQPLPEWEEWGQIAMDGLMSMVISFVWGLPLALVSTCLAIPFVFISNGDDGGAIFWILISCFSLLIILLALLVALVSPAAVVHYAVTGEFGKAFQFREIIAMVRQNLGAYLMVMLVVVVVVPIISSLGSILLGCGALFTTFFGFLVMHHAYGQAYRTAVGNVESEAEFAY
jgi:hypothetical protein